MTSICHYDHLDEAHRALLFMRPASQIDDNSEARLIGEALGALLYIPATRADVAADLVRQRGRGAQAVVIDLEDAVPAADRHALASRVADVLSHVSVERAVIPQIFLRPSDMDGLRDLARAVDPRATAQIRGIVLPKVTSEGLPEQLAAVCEMEAIWGQRLLVMPVLESPVIARVEHRVAELVRIRSILDGHCERVAAVRIGASDLGGAFGVRRDGERTVYEVAAISAAIGDIVSVFAREDPFAYPIAGPVWEHFAPVERVQKPLLRASPYADHGLTKLREQLITSRQDALITEVQVDRANGLTGKSVIHPTHVPLVHALHAVVHEEYLDATAILHSGAGGVSKGAEGNRMNENSPHRRWAQRTVRRSRAFGVLAEGISYVDVLAAEVASS